MSGGSHDYICYKIEEELCGQMEDAELNDLMKDIANLAHDLEWYHSADTCETTYRESVTKFKKKWFGSDRTERLKGYIDKEVAEVKNRLYILIGENVITEDSLVSNLGLSKKALREMTGSPWFTKYVWQITERARRFYEISGVSEETLDEVQERLRTLGFDFAKEDDS